MTNQHQTVLVIGDAEQNRQPLTHLLKECGYQVVAETSIDQAIEAMSDFTGRTRPSLILCDLNRVSDNPAMLGLLRAEIDIEVIGFGDGTSVTEGIRLVSKRPANVAQMSRLVNGTLSRSAKAA